MSHHNPWKGFVLGMFGSLAGLAAMNAYWTRVAPRVREIPGDKLDRWGKGEMIERYEDVSIYGQQYEEGQSAAEVIGQRLYRSLSGGAPRSKEGAEMLRNMTHYVSRMLQGGAYGAMQRRRRLFDVRSGLLFGTVLWMFGDEVVMPLLGLHAGPTKKAPIDHINRLGAHMTFGAVTAVATQALRKIF